ncbi:UNVERIFIED_CONTAM: hypothetical protein K2H54_036940 [Gekko kuhli]
MVIFKDLGYWWTFFCPCESSAMADQQALVVLAHLERASFNHAMKEAAVDVLQWHSWIIVISDLYTMHFNSVLSHDDITGSLWDPEHFNYTSKVGLA